MRIDSTAGGLQSTFLGAPRRLRRRGLGLLAALAIASAATAMTPRDALACGGFFCFTQPVDQSAERILYVQQKDSITAHIQISYTGDDKEFSWVLPLQKVPELGIGSDSIFSMLENATAPSFQLQWENTDSCYGYSPCEFADTATGGGGGGPSTNEGGVVVLKEETVGPYEAVVIKGNAAADLVKWLNDNGYVQPAETTPLVESYVKQGYVFLALRMAKDKSAGDLAPIVVTLKESAPCLPLRLTKLAVQPDMPIVAWVLGDHRAIPKNFLHVILNDAVLDWMQPGTNYKTVVSKAVDQASGHAFVTEMAQKTADLKIPFANKTWDPDKLAKIATPGAFLQAMLQEGYPRTTQLQQLIRKYVPKPAEFEAVSDQEFYGCVQCESCAEGTCAAMHAAVAKQPFDAAAFAKDVKTSIVEPLFLVQSQYEAAGWLTRMYTTISGDEMDKDPIFAFNPDLPAVERAHTAKAVPICEGTSKQATAATLTFANGQSMQVTLPKDWSNCQYDFAGGGVATFGKGESPLVAAGGQPAARVEVLDESGPGIEIDPRVADLVDAELNKAVAGKESLSAAFLATLPKSTWDPSKTTVEPLPGNGTSGGTNVGSASSGGCSATAGSSAPASAPLAGWLVALAALALVWRRRGAQ